MGSEFHLLETLVQYPKEDLNKEYKNWLDLSDRESQADLAKALIAIANHGGGYVVLGFNEDEAKNLVIDEKRPENLNNYCQDRINGIIQRYADPVFHCECHLVEHPGDNQKYPIFIVPGGHKTPIRTKIGSPNERLFRAHVYLVRRPGPKSESPQSAQEWNELITRCMMNSKEELLEKMRALITGTPAQIVENQIDVSLDDWINSSLDRFNTVVTDTFPEENPSRYSYGKWCVGYLVTGNFDVPSLTQFRDILHDAQGNETGWPVWLTSVSHSQEYVFEDTIERIINPQTSSDGAHSDYWRVSPDGKLFLLRGYQEDGSAPYDIGTILDYTLPIWRIGECVLHSARLALKLSNEPLQITLNAIWDGLKDRTLVSWASKRYFLFRGGTCHADRVTSKITFESDKIESNFTDIVSQLLKPLYESFDFYSLPAETLTHELKRLRKQI